MMEANSGSLSEKDSSVSTIAAVDDRRVSRGSCLEVKFAEDYDKDSIVSSSCLKMEDDSDDDDSSDVEGENSKTKIPDGGWGWVVVFSSFSISMIADGISFSFGLLYVELLNEFGASKSMTSWIGSLFIAVPLLSGPVMSSLVDKYGCRNMTILGGVISTVGFVLSAYAKSIYVMYVTFGVIAGLGLGMNYVTAVVSVAYWFEKRRNLATGLGACGTGFGTFIYAPITQYLLGEFGWRGTTLLLAGTFLNICVCGMLMRDPKWLIERDNNRSRSMSKRTSSIGSVSGKSALEDIEEIRKLLKAGNTNNEYFLQNLVTSTESPRDAVVQKEHHRSDFNLPTFIKQNEKVPLEVLQQLGSNKKLYNLILENYPSLLFCRSTSLKGINKMDDKAEIGPVRVPVTVSMKLKKAKPLIGAISNDKNNGQLVKSLDHTEPLLPTRINGPNVNILPRVNSLPWILKKHVQQPGYLKNIKMHRNSVMYRGAMLNIRKYRLRASSCPDIYRNSMTTLAKETEEAWYDEWLELVKSMFDFSFFSELHFLLLSMSTVLLFTWFIVPYYYLPEHMLSMGYSESEVSSILSLIGITSTIGMVFLGWAGDQPWMNVIKTYAVCLILCGISCGAMFYFCDQYALLLTFSSTFGLSFASSFSFIPMIVVELLSLERFTTAYGLILLCQGCGHLWGPPLAGYLFDVTGSWTQSFLQACIWIIIAGLLVGIIPFTNNRNIWNTSKNETVVKENKDCIKV